LENRRLLAQTAIGVYTAGTTGSEAVQLLIDGAVVASWTNVRVYDANRQFQGFFYTAESEVAIDRVRVQFVNDGQAPNGVNRDLYVDGVTLDGYKYESEATSVYSTGVWDEATGGALPGFRQSEILSYNGYLQFGARGSTIVLHLAGATGTEQARLVVDGATAAIFPNVGGDYAARQFVSFSYDAPSAQSISDLRVVFDNDGLIPSGEDRNLRVDGLTLDGIKYETEAPNVYTNAFYTAGQGRTFGRLRTEEMPLGGYFQFGANGTVVEIRAAGNTGQEQGDLSIAGALKASFFNIGGDYATGQFRGLIYNSPTVVTIDQVRFAFVNDAVTAAGDRNLRVDSVVLDGYAYQAEAANVLSTGAYLAEVGGALPGLWQSEYLHVNGYLQFGSTAQPGTLALGTTLLTVDENGGTASIPVLRSGGSDTTIALRYTTVDATAIAGSDYTARSGFLVFGPGETSKSIVVPILNDSTPEANEAFNVAGDDVIGGGSITFPRTATVTIVDDEPISTFGSGNGLLGQYYNNADLTGFVFERTDATVNFNWGGGSPGSSMGADTFSVRWVGKVEPLYTQTYTFSSSTDDGVRLWVDNRLIIDSWRSQNTVVAGQIALERGRRYDLRLEYYEGTKQARQILQWQSASQALQVIPQSQLYSNPPAPTEVGAFAAQLVTTGLTGPTTIDFAAGGRIFFGEQRGVVRAYKDANILPTPFLDIRSQVNYVQDRGLIGLAVHPNFPATPYVYVAYTYDPPETASRSGLAGPDGSGNRVARVSRFTADPAYDYMRAIPGSEVVLVGTNSTWANITRPDLDSTDDLTLPPSGGQNGELRDILIADSRSHSVGNLDFGPDGKLYVANGDGTSFGRVDPRSERVQSLDSLSGKILRIDPITGAGLADNPFYNGDPGANRSKVYDYGLRNPFRFAFNPVNQQLVIGDVGWNTWEEINVGRGKNFGWPWYEGGGGQNLQTGGYRDLAAAQTFYASNPLVAAPLWSRPHSDGAVAIVVGDFYTGTVYPPSYRNALFISDVGDRQIRVVRFNADGSLASVSPLRTSVGTVVEMSMGPDGYLYYADIVGGVIGRFNFIPGGVAAVDAGEATAESDALIGDFNGDAVVDGGDVLQWQRETVTVASGPTPLAADADFNGTVNELDLSLVLSRFGWTRTSTDLLAQLSTSPLLASAGWSDSAAVSAEPLREEDLFSPETFAAPASALAVAPASGGAQDDDWLAAIGRLTQTPEDLDALDAAFEAHLATSLPAIDWGV
jgi:glucose/arabinose dehydrogenase